MSDANMASDAMRAARCVENARQKLTELTKVPETASIGTVTKAIVKAGDSEGVGALLRLAALRPIGNELSRNSMVRFRAEADRCFEGLQKVALNFSVVTSLFLTIFVALAVDTTFSEPYDAPEQFGEGPWQELASWVVSDASFTFFSNSTFVSPSDRGAQRALRRAFITAEWATLALGTAYCLIGLWESMIIYATWASIPDPITKYQYILEHPGTGPSLWAFFYTQLGLLALALTLIAARVSGIAFLCNLFGLCFFTCRFYYSFYAKGGSCAALCRSLHAEAHRLLAQGYYDDNELVVMVDYAAERHTTSNTQVAKQPQ